MPISKNVKRNIAFICFFFFSWGMNFKSYNLPQYLPADLLKELLISDCLSQAAFFILLAIYEPLEITFKGKKIYLMFVLVIIYIFYIVSSCLRYL